MLSTTISSGPFPQSAGLIVGLKVLFLPDKVVWSALRNGSSIMEKREFIKPSTCRSGNLNTSLKIRIVSIAHSEYRRGRPGLPLGLGNQASIISPENQRVISPLASVTPCRDRPISSKIRVMDQRRTLHVPFEFATEPFVLGKCFVVNDH